MPIVLLNDGGRGGDGIGGDWGWLIYKRMRVGGQGIGMIL